MSVRPYVVGNWKMNGSRALLAEARSIDRGAARHPQVEVGLAPPFTLINAMSEAVQSVAIGAQDCHVQPQGAFTGCISAPMLVDAGAGFVILGHSERRTQHGESSEAVRNKGVAALVAGLALIVCVGETEAERDAGLAESVVTGQLAGSLPLEQGQASSLTIAYEPVWSIGTGRLPSAEDIVAMHRAIRGRLIELYGPEAGGGIRILYGGSVTPDNAARILGLEGVDGALVGGASLAADSFLAIVVAAAEPGGE